MKYLLFLLYAPFSSWGSPLPGTIRRTDDHPTKSGIMGLLASSLGIVQEMEPEYTHLSASLGFACREDHPGVEMRDFHTVRVGENPIISERYYLCDAAFTICLWQKGDQPSLEKIANALNNPEFMPFLGRKCCIAGLPPIPNIVEAENLFEAFNLFDALSQEELSEILGIDITKPRRVFWEGDDASFKIERELKRSDQPIGICKYSSRIELIGTMGGG